MARGGATLSSKESPARISTLACADSGHQFYPWKATELYTAGDSGRTENTPPSRYRSFGDELNHTILLSMYYGLGKSTKMGRFRRARARGICRSVDECAGLSEYGCEYPRLHATTSYVPQK